MKTQIIKNIAVVGFLITFMLFVSGCSNNSPMNSSSPGPGASPNLSVGMMPDVTNTPPPTTFTISNVKLLLKKIEVENEQNESEEIVMGPIVVNLILGNNNNTSVSSAALMPGTFTKIGFDVHQIEEGEHDPDHEFMEGNDEHHRFSVIVNGTLNGVNFVYKSRAHIRIEIELTTPITITGSREINLVIAVDPYLWFKDADGNLLNPNDPANRHIIDSNIRRAFKKAFQE